MAIVKYDQKDIMPIVIGVLHFTASSFMAFAYRIALENSFSDLKHMVDPENLDQTAVEMVKGLDDPLNTLLMQCFDDIIGCSDTFSLMNNFDVYEFMMNDRLSASAQAFNDRLSFYCVAGRKSSKGAYGDLYRFTFCIDHLIYHLCRLIIFKKREVVNYSRKHFLYLQKIDFSELDSYEQYEVRLLVELAHKLNVTCDKIVAIAGKGRWKRRCL